MPRTSRAIKAGGYYHVLNRGNGRQRIFFKDRDYAAFCRIVCEGLERYPVDLMAWCLMPNHWHLVVRPREADALSSLLGWVGVTHVRRHHTHYHKRGGGHLYEGRFKSFPIQDDSHFRTVCRYVEANAKRAKLVSQAERWPWSSLAMPETQPTDAAAKATRAENPEAPADARPPLAAWPVERPADWVRWVNEPLGKAEIESLRTSVNRGRPFGDDQWVAKTAAKLGLESTLRARGRPRKEARREAGMLNVPEKRTRRTPSAPKRDGGRRAST